MVLVKAKRDEILGPLSAVSGIIERRHTLPVQDFPRLATPGGEIARFALSQKALRRLLGLVQYAMAQQDIRYYLNGLLMVVEDRQLKLVATDGHRLAYASRKVGGK